VTVAVSGSASMLGKRIAKRLGARCGVVSVGRHSGSDIVMDLRDPVSATPSGLMAEVMIHCAASFGGNRIEEMIENEVVNAVGCLRIAQLAAAIKCRHLIDVSTISALAENVGGSSYGLSKRHGQENLELACGELGIDLTILSVTQIYDDLGEARKHQPMLYRIIDCARAGRPFQFFGSKDPSRNFLFVEDLVSVIERVMDGRAAGSYAVVHPVSYRLSEIVAMAFEVFGRTAEIVSCPDKPDIPSVWYPADTALYDLINYRPETDLRAGIAMIRDRMQ
jgi:nucleoside-diphosphate-sugar epimerase